MCATFALQSVIERGNDVYSPFIHFPVPLYHGQDGDGSGATWKHKEGVGIQPRLSLIQVTHTSS